MSSIFQTEQPNDRFLRCAGYLRYSTKMQKPASIEEQLMTCREFAESVGWEILPEHIYRDEALSGTKRTNRIGFQALEAAAGTRPRPFDYVLFDDTSRLGRDHADVLNFVKLMEHHGIKVCFVSQRLDSSDENFTVMLNTYSMMDQMNIKRLGVKVFSSQKWHVNEGYHVGSVPYGYRIVSVQNTADPAAIGRASTLGKKLEIVEEQAVVVRRIFQQFVDGHAMWAISRELNGEKIPSPQNVRSGRLKAEWSHDAIKHILRNPKSRGENLWNVSYQTEHPHTGRIRKEIKPAHEHVRVKAEHLRIVDDELWFKAAEGLKRLEDKQATRRLGGYSRAQNGPYLLSGLPTCGICGSRMRIGGIQGKGVYECPNHRQGRGCTNALRIREERLTKQLVHALAGEMFDPEYLEVLVDEVHSELQAAWRKQREQVSREQIPQLREARDACQAKVDNLIDAIEAGESKGLSARLEARYSELARLDLQLKAARGSGKLHFSKEELHAVVRENVANLEQVLKADVALARQVLHKHIRSLALFPDESPTGPVCFVIGQVDLFRRDSEGKEGVLLGCEGTLTPQQHTDPYYNFMLYLDPGQEECPLLEPLSRLLSGRPELSLDARTPGAWAKLLREMLGDEWDSRKPLGSGAIGRCFRVHREILEKRLKIDKTPNGKTMGHLYRLNLRAAA